MTLAEWQVQLGVGQAELSHLVDYRILRQVDSGPFVLSFVGIVVFANRLLFAQPKFGDASSFDLAATLRILRAYFARSAGRRPSVDIQRDPEFGNSDVLREFDALTALQDWFSTHGLYRREQAITGARGRPHWVKTVARAPALVMQGAVVYPTTVAERREGVLNDISGLQASALVLLLSRYGLPVPAAVRNAELATGSAIDQWPLDVDTRNYYERRLANEQRSVYRSDTLRLFKILRELLSTRLAQPLGQPQIYGTTAFYSVWEDACRTGLGQDIPADSVAQIAQPTWWVHTTTGAKTQISQSQVPDLVVLRNGWVVILDAKYYYPFPHSRPGGPDIVKQIYYAESLNYPAERVLSIFVLPKPGATIPVLLGYATIEQAQRPFGRIEAWGIDPRAILTEYPTVSASRSNTLIDAILSSRDAVAKLVAQPPANISSQ